jgi:hypothetical protein
LSGQAALRGLALLVFGSLVLLAAGPAGGGELPKADQALVNAAIDKGVKYLRDNQQPNGGWSTDGKHVIGLAALPGLTLLESGVPPNDPAIKRVALLIRQGYVGVESTYEIALSILFLDRLNDPADKKIIQSLALRLVAGQNNTGGWSYKCPLLPPRVEKDLLTTLQQLPPLAVEGRTDQTGPGTEQVSAKLNVPFFGTTTYKVQANQAPPGATQDSPSSPGSDFGSTGDPPSADAAQALQIAATHLTRQNYCIKSLETLPVPAEKTTAAKDDPKSKPPDKKVVIPVTLRAMPIFLGDKLVMVEAENQKSDNSNTQFAILALWAAQRYDVPMDRTLRLLVRRFQTSQNPVTGHWHYHFFVGGTDKEWGPQMTAVGLLGLAVGHGMAAPVPGAPVQRQVKDPAMVKGFVALNRYIGQPAGRMQGLPQNISLYYLWSLERVAVLYGLEKIGNKDWYRWGAEILVSNQQGGGNWQDGKYPGAVPVTDTCFALLFLQRANLAKDLSEKLPFNPNDLDNTVTEEAKAEQARKDADKAAKEREEREKAMVPTTPMPVPPMPDPVVFNDPQDSKDPTKDQKPETKPETKPDSPRTSSSPPAAEPAEKKKIWPYILFGLGGLLVLGAGIFVVVQTRGSGRPDDDEDEEEDERPRAKKKKPVKKSSRR